MKTIRITLSGCDDETVFEIEATEEQIEFLKMIAKKSEEVSTCKCMPTMDIKILD